MAYRTKCSCIHVYDPGCHRFIQRLHEHFQRALAELLCRQLQAVPQLVQHDRSGHRWLSSRGIRYVFASDPPRSSDTHIAPTVNLAAAVVLELRTSSSSSEPVIRFQFKNGTDDTELHTLPLVFGDWNGTVSGTDVPLSTFVAAFQPVGINNTLEWCQVCGQTTERGCDVALAAASAGVTDSVYLALNSSSSPAAVTVVMVHERITPLAAGFLGAGLTAAVFMLVLAGLLFSWGRGKKERKGPAAAVVHFDGHVREYVDEKQPSF